uniref:Uncharacterized protein n=1 Tax=Desertifilum tharense IPPAS B-1220 TaxID=1781255 RepID=A0ACD5H0H3_9CYAN
MIDPGTDPGLDPLLREWGVRLDNRFAVDATGSGTFGRFRLCGTLNYPLWRSSHYSRFPRWLFVLSNGTRPIEVSAVPGVNETPLLITADQS